MPADNKARCRLNSGGRSAHPDGSSTENSTPSLRHPQCGTRCCLIGGGALSYGSLAMLAAMRRASTRVSKCAAERLPGSSWHERPN